MLNLELMVMCHTNMQVRQRGRSLQPGTACVQSDHRHDMWCADTGPYRCLQMGSMSHNAVGEDVQWGDGDGPCCLWWPASPPYPLDTLSLLFSILPHLVQLGFLNNFSCAHTCTHTHTHRLYRNSNSLLPHFLCFQHHGQPTSEQAPSIAVQRAENLSFGKTHVNVGHYSLSCSLHLSALTSSTEGSEHLVNSLTNS